MLRVNWHFSLHLLDANKSLVLLSIYTYFVFANTIRKGRLGQKTRPMVNCYTTIEMRMVTGYVWPLCVVEEHLQIKWKHCRTCCGCDVNQCNNHSSIICWWYNSIVSKLSSPFFVCISEWLVDIRNSNRKRRLRRKMPNWRNRKDTAATIRRRLRWRLWKSPVVCARYGFQFKSVTNLRWEHFCLNCGDYINRTVYATNIIVSSFYPILQSLMPDPKTYRQHFENKHPKSELPADLKDVVA